MSRTLTLKTKTLTTGDDIDLVATDAPDDVREWPEDIYFLVQVVTPKGDVRSHIYKTIDSALYDYNHYEERD